MPNKSYEWDSYDKEAQKAIAELLEKSGFSDRSIPAKINNKVSFARIRDIRVGRRAPVRLSEFIALCKVCGANPVNILHDVIAKAEIAEEQKQQVRKPFHDPKEVTDEEVQDTIQRFLNGMGVAAYQDESKNWGDPDSQIIPDEYYDEPQ